MKGLFKDKVFLRNITGLAIPIMLNELINSLINIMDTFMTGKLGAASVTAVGLSNQVFFLFTLICFGISSGASIFMGQYWGSGDIKGVRKVLGIGLIMSELAAFVFFLGTRVFPHTIMQIYSQDNEVIDLGMGYLKIIGFSYFIAALTTTVNASLKAIGEAKQPMFTTLLSLISNIVFNSIFIFGMHMGVRGAALGTVCARSIEAAVQMTLIIVRKLPVLVPRLSDYVRWNKKFLVRYAIVATPVLFNEFMWALGTTIYNIAYKYSGTQSQAAVQVAGSVQNLFVVSGFGIGAACGIIISNTLGARDAERAIDYAFKSTALTTIFSVISGIILALLAPFIISFFDIDTQGQRYALYMVYIVAVGLTVKNLNYINIVGILRNGGDTLFGLITDTASVWLIGIPMAFLGSKILGLPIYITYAMVYSEEFFKLIFSEARVLKKKWANTVI